MKRILKKILIFILKIEAKIIIKKYNPKIIGITGTVGKTSTKDAIYTVLSSRFNVRKSEKSYNSEIGVPLTILGAKNAWNNIFDWIKILWSGFVLGIKKENKANYPNWLILEMGVGKPKDMDFLISFVRPDIAVITAFGEVPSHIEFFENTEEIIKEKSKIVDNLRENGTLILNGDDKAVFKLKNKTKTKTIVYGYVDDEYNNLEEKNSEFDLIASNYNISTDGISFKLNYKGNIIPVRMNNVFGKQFIYCALAAIATGISLELNLIEIIESLSKFKPPPGRMSLLEGIKNTFILDDTYNSSPLALRAALNVLEELPAERKIAVLGDMLELGKFTIEEHKKIGRLIGEMEKEKKLSLLFTVGPRAKFIADEARSSGFNEKNIFSFSSVEEVKDSLQEKIKEGDLILVKGSQAMRMEKIVEEIMAHPEEKENLLVRQEKEWQNR